MAVQGYWADPVMERDRPRVFWPALDGMIDKDDPVLFFDEVLEGVDWSQWESKSHVRHRGQPPIHPKHLAGVIL
ncbi:MAG: hypothetical protein R3E01_07405 [Pirellulaceae bacterium]|nr:hypothetical protein [Planctomycetales bacterium]